MNIQQESTPFAVCSGSEEQGAPTTSGPCFTFPAAFTDQLWKSMRLSPKRLTCEKYFYLKGLRARERARTVWKCVPAAGSNGKTGKNGKLKNKPKAQDRAGPFDSDGGNCRRGNTRVPNLKNRLKVICREEKLPLKHPESGHSAASNTRQASRENSDLVSPVDQHDSTKSSTPEELSIQSNSVHKMVSNSSVGTMDGGLGAIDAKASVGSPNKLRKDCSGAMSQNGCKWSSDADKMDNQVEKVVGARKRGTESLDKSTHCERPGEVRPIPVRRKLRRLIVRSLDRNNSISSPQGKDLDDSTEIAGQESSALNDEELAMKLHHDLNAPSLRSRVRRSGANTSGLSTAGSLPDSARNSKTRPNPGQSQDGSRSLASEELCVE